MIISASRRTDIPAFFSDWLFNRLDEQYAYMRNPMNFHQVSKINLAPDVVDCIVLWSKNPQPMLSKLNKLEKYMYYFQFTLNAYHKDIEQNLPTLHDRIETFQQLSRQIGKERIIWRYDPILLNDSYTMQWHIDAFSYIADKLSAYTEKVTISFIDLYRQIAKNMCAQNIQELDFESKNLLAKELSSIAHAHGLIIDTCAEDIDLAKYDIQHAACIDAALISRLLGTPISVVKDKNQRPVCGCAASIDIGFYNTCQNGCLYCYANHSAKVCAEALQVYDPHSPLLCSYLTELDKVTERTCESLKEMQVGLF